MEKVEATAELARFYRELSDQELKAFWDAGGIINGVEYPMASIFLHSHTDLGSPKDSILTVNQYVKTAASMGASAIAVTDHGTMYGVVPLYKACDNYNVGKPEDEQIKCIMGIELYVCNTFDVSVKKKQTRLHLIMYAKNEVGYHVMCRICTEGYKHVIEAGGNKYPCVSKDDLMKWIGPGTAGHGQVILTSACIGGVVAGMMFESDNEQKNADAIAAEAKILVELYENYTQQNNRLEELTKEKDRLASLTKKTYSKRLNALKKNPDDAKMAELQAEMQESEDAKVELAKVQNMHKMAKTGLTSIKSELTKRLAKAEGDTVEDQYNNRVEQLKEAFNVSYSNIIPEEQVEQKFTEEMLWYQNLAGKENWFIELQFHGIPQEKKYMHVLAQLAKKLDMPVVAANDAHMATRDQTEARKIVNSLRFDATWEDAREDEYELYLKTDAELYQWLCKEVPSEIAFEAMQNRKLIADACNVKLKKENHYPTYVA